VHNCVCAWHSLTDLPFTFICCCIACFTIAYYAFVICQHARLILILLLLQDDVSESQASASKLAFLLVTLNVIPADNVCTN